jgi:hypothetical protein
VQGTLLKVLPIAKLKKLRDAAREYPCAHCRKEGFTVAAHNNELALGRGAYHKTPDFLVAYLCGDPGGCHDLVDGRAGGLTLEQKRAMWCRAYVQTVAWWFRDARVVVA